MKFEEVKDLTMAELVNKRRALSEELVLARMKNSLGQLKNSLDIRMVRRDLARVNTAITLKAKN